MLIIELVNKTQRGQIADYYFKVKVNSEVIAEGWVEGHDRMDGWQALVEKFAEAVKETEVEKRNRDYLALMALSSEAKM